MSDIFISYAREDLERIKPLVKALEAQGWLIWWDPQIRTGERVHKRIEKELEQAKTVIVVWSDAALESDWVLEEAEEGKERGILFPIKIEDVKAPLGFRKLQTANLIDWQGATEHSSFVDLVKSLTEHLGATSTTKTTHFVSSSSFQKKLHKIFTLG